MAVFSCIILRHLLPPIFIDLESWLRHKIIIRFLPFLFRFCKNFVNFPNLIFSKICVTFLSKFLSLFCKFFFHFMSTFLSLYSKNVGYWQCSFTKFLLLFCQNFCYLFVKIFCHFILKIFVTFLSKFWILEMSDYFYNKIVDNSKFSSFYEIFV